MLSSIDEKSEECDEAARRLNSSSSAASKSTVQDVIGGHGPWQFRYWLLFFFASGCQSMVIFSLLPLSPSGECVKSITSGSKPRCEVCDSSNCTVFNDSELSDPCINTYADFALSEKENQFCFQTHYIVYAKCLNVLAVLLTGPIVYVFLYNKIFKFNKHSLTLISGLIHLSCSLAIAWATNPALFLALRFLLSLETTKVYFIAVLFLMEYVGEDFRLMYGYTGHLGWVMAHFALPIVSWLCRDWTQFSIALSFVSLAMFLLLCFTPDSVDTYVSRGERGRAEKMMRRAAWCNGFPIHDVEEFSQSLMYQDEQEEINNWNKSHLQKYFELVFQFFVGFSSSFMYFMSVWLTDWVWKDRGGYFALMATTEVASTLILLFLAYFISHKRLWSATTALASLSLLFMYAKSSGSSAVFSTFPYLFTVFFTSGSWVIILLQTLLQPLNSAVSKSKLAISITAMCAGALLAIFNDLQKLDQWEPKLLVIFAIPNLAIGISTAVIPDRYYTL